MVAVKRHPERGEDVVTDGVAGMTVNRHRRNDNENNCTIPFNLENLADFTWLDLSIHELTGTIPWTLGDLTQFSSLYLNSNQLTGTILSTLVNLWGLEQISLNDNELSGPIPSTFKNLIQLDYLELMRNQLSNMTRLSFLLIHSNQLTGTIPTTMGNLTQHVSFLCIINSIQLTVRLCSIPGINIRVDCVNIMCMFCRDGSYANCSSFKNTNRR